jgi:glycosyltransferase involved in cell wall biosynthesis
MPRSGNEWPGADALWVTASGWAAAARRRYGAAWVVTPDAISTPEEVLEFTGVSSPMSRTRPSWVPPVVTTAVKDARLFIRSRRLRDVGERLPWSDAEVRLVWQHHDLFHHAGEGLAARRDCPFVLFVHAPQVWEARQWGVVRPGWGRLIERFSEKRSFDRADVIACVSDEVRRAVVGLGVSDNRVVVTPMAVDLERYRPDDDGAMIRSSLGWESELIIGWIGTFRPFHALGMALDAFAAIARERSDCRLLLVGHGQERERLEERCAALGIEEVVAFAGAVEHSAVPGLLAALDVAVVTADASAEFHYSPLKLKEYLAAGRAVVAPALGEISRTLSDGVDALLYEPGDLVGFEQALNRLADDEALRRRLGAEARRGVETWGTWDAQLDKVIARI